MISLVDKFIQKYGRLPTEYDTDYLEMLRMGKYRIKDVPDVSPGKCGNCGASKQDGRQYIDFGLQIEWYGAFFLCSLCLQDIASNLTFFQILQDQLKKALEVQGIALSLHDQGVLLHEKQIQLHKELEAYYDSLYTILDSSAPNTTSSVGTDTAASKSTSSSSKSATNETKSRAVKPTSVSGSKNLPSLAELLESDS